MPAFHKAIGKALPNERAAIAFLRDALPDGYYLITNVELSAGRNRTYEHDAIVVAPHMVFPVELKAYSGRTVGNRDRWELEGGKIVDSPVPLQNQKARVLKGTLSNSSHRLRDVWVQPLVYMTARDAKIELTRGYDATVCTHADIITALTNRQAWRGARDLTRAEFDDIRAVLEDGRSPLREMRLGSFELDMRLPEAPGVQHAIWRGRKHGNRRTLHVYDIKGGDEKTRERCREFARREANLHERLRGGVGLINYLDLEIVVEPEEKFVLSFEDTRPYLPLPDWLDRHTPGLQPRLRVAQRIVEALRFVHSKEIVHRGLTPQAVLVPNVAEPDQVRLYALELARDLAHQIATISSGRLSSADQRCWAPELLRQGDATRRSDRFALGATLFELFCGEPAYENAAQILAGEPVGPMRLDGMRLPEDIELTVDALLSADPMARPELNEVLDVLQAAQLEPAEPPRLALERGTRFGDYELVEPLGEGATGAAWKVQHRIDGQYFVAKFAHDLDASDELSAERVVLQRVQHPNLVRYHSMTTHAGAAVMLLHHVAGVSGDEWALLADPLSLDDAQQVGEGLFGALAALHAAEWLHRDVKPANLLLAEPHGTLTLIDLSLACGVRDEATRQVLVGTAPYKDPLLFDAGAWSTRDDLFAAWLTLFEVLTGTHPFGGIVGKDAEPQIAFDQLPYPDDARARLAALAADALSMDAARRPASAEEARARWRAALSQTGPAVEPPSVSVEPAPLPIALSLNTPIADLPLSVRAQGALHRLGITVAGQLGRVHTAELQAMRNVGRKTATEIQGYARAVRAQLGDGVERPVALAPPPPPLHPVLVDDARPLTALGVALTPTAGARLEAEGITTVGALAATPRMQLLSLKAIGKKRLDALVAALDRLAQDAPSTSLDGIDARLRAELGKGYAAVAAVFGLEDGVARRHADAASHIGRTRQRVDQALQLDPLRAEASVGHQLARAVSALIPDAGFISIERLGAQLGAVLPFEGALSAPGFVRLGLALATPGDKGHDAIDSHIACRPPWTPSVVEILREALMHNANWPPIAPEAAADLLWERASAEGLADHLKGRQIGPAGLLKAVRSTCEDVVEAPDGSLFTPPVSFGDAVRACAQEPALLAPVDAAVAFLRQRFVHVLDPVDQTAELRAIGLEVIDDRIVPIARPEASPIVPVKVDAPIRTHYLTPDGALDVRDLLALSATGGFRVIGLPPASHHRLSESLHAALIARLGAERVRLIDLDRAIIEALRAHDLWDDALAEEALAHPDFSWLVGEVGAALTARVAEGRRGTVTVLARPTLLGPLGLMDWLHGLYETARGGRYGLLVLAMPGGVHDGRVRINEAWPLTYTPDMAAVVFQEAHDAR